MATHSIFDSMHGGGQTNSFSEGESQAWQPPDALQPAARILVADDQADVRYALCLLLKNAGMETCTASGPAEVLRAVEAGQADIAILDLNYTRDTTSGGEGLELITRVRRLDPALPILAMTAWGSVDVAVEAMRRGAADFVQKPWSAQQLLEKVHGLIALQQHTRREQVEERAERDDAIQVQRKLLSIEVPEGDGADVEIAGTSRALRFIGGDYCHVEPLGQRRYAISIADVAGKGVPGALVSASLRAAARPVIAADQGPAAVCAALNTALADVVPSGKFVAFFFGVLDLDRRTLTYCNAGHNPPLVISRNGSQNGQNGAGVHSLTVGGAVLGYFPRWNFQQEEVQLSSGDRVLLFTDGIIEAGNAGRGEFGAERLAEAASSLRHLGAEAMQQALLKSVSDHCNGNFHDDATLVVVALN